MSSFPMWINGLPCAGSSAFGVINPASEEVFAEAPECDAQHLEQSLVAASSAFNGWQSDLASRRAALQAAARALEAETEAIAPVLTQEQGKPLAAARSEVSQAVATLERTAQMNFPDETLQESTKRNIELRHRPFGVVAGITPWNFPLMIAVSKVAPALLAGNTMVLKPSPFTPLSTLMLGRVLNSVLPAGVLNVISGADDSLGARLTQHPLVRNISFTGSVATGKRVATAAAQSLKRVTLELGGNDPGIVLEQVDLSKALPSIFWSTFFNTGQVCLAIKRLYVPESLLEATVSGLVKLAQQVQVGDGMEPNTLLGPINNAAQLARIELLLQDARARGAVIHCGGERLKRRGYFFAPTIVTGLAADADLVSQEQFGPVLPVLGYRDLGEVIQQANSSDYALGASVWSSDEQAALAVAQQLHAGTTWINQHMVLTARAPFGGAKLSGVGYASGRWGLSSFLQKHVINSLRV